MGVYGSPQLNNYTNDKREYYGSPSTSDYIKWIMIPTVLSLFTCGVGGLILMVVWACSNEQPARRNLMRAYLYIVALPLIALILYLVMEGQHEEILRQLQPRKI